MLTTPTPGNIRLPPGAVDKFKHIRANVADMGTLTLYDYAPAATVDLFVIAFLLHTKPITGLLYSYLAWDGTNFFESAIADGLKLPTIFPYSQHFVGDGSTKFTYSLDNYTGATLDITMCVWAWEEKKA